MPRKPNDTDTMLREAASALSPVDFAAVMEEMPRGIVIFDAEDRLLYCNAAYRNILGESADLLVPGVTFEGICRGAADRGHIRGLDEAGKAQWIKERVARHQTCGAPFEENLGSGRVLMTQEIRLSNGGILGIRADVTELHQRHQDLLNSLSDGFAIFDSQDRLVFWNDRYADFCNGLPNIPRFGVTFEEIARARADNGWYDPDRPASSSKEQIVAARMAEHTAGAGETVLKLKDGRWLLVRDRRSADGSYAVAATDVTAIKDREAALRASQERFRALLEVSSDWFWETDTEHRFALVERGTKLFGLARIDHIIGRRRWEMHDDATDPASWDQHIADLEARRPFRQFRFARLRAGDRLRHYEISGEPFYDADGNFAGYRGTGTEVTDRVDAEQSAASARAQLEAAIESLEEAFAIFDRDDRLVLVNTKWRQIYQVIDEQIRPGLSFEEHVTLSVRAGMIPDAMGREEEWIRWRCREVRRDGTKIIRQFSDGRWLIVSDYRSRDGSTVCVYTDISDIKHNEERLAELAMIAERSDNGILTTDRDGAITWINEALTRMTGYTLEDVRGKTPFETFFQGAQTDHESVTALKTARAEGRSYDVEALNFRKDGSPIWLHLSATPIRDANGAVIKWLTISRDITRQQQANQALADARDEAERASSAKSTFLANMSHELRTPLNAIIGFSEVMMEETFGPLGADRYRQYAKGIHESGSHLLGLINDILDFSKAGAGLLKLDEQTVDAAAVVAEAVQVMQARADNGGVDLQVVLPDHPVLVQGDPRKLRQILLNLLSNAVKFTSAGGHVAVSLNVTDDDSVLLQVSDTGIGIASEDIPKAFVAFSQIDNRLSRQYQGTGLGLPLTRKLAELHDGTVDLESTPGKGTVATVRLPPERLVRL